MLSKILAALFIVVVFGAGWYSVPTKTITKTVTQTVIHEVQTENKDTKQDVHKDKNIKITETTTKDGTKTKITEITDKSTSTKETDDQISKVLDETKKVMTEKITESGAGKFYIGGMAGTQLSNMSNTNFGLQAHIRAFGPITVGAYTLLKDQQFGLTAGLTW
jgi:hypothetical protein